MSGEANTASNVGSSPAIGPFIQKTGVNLEFRKVLSESTGLLISLGDESEVLFEIDPTHISHRHLADLDADDHSPYIPRDGARPFTAPIAGKTPISGNQLATKSYVDGAASDKTYTHNQIFASTTWVVVHNLDKYPTVDIVDSGGTVVIGDILYNNLSRLTITLSAITTGRVFCN